MDQKQLTDHRSSVTDVTYVIRGGRSLTVCWKRICFIQWIRIAIDVFLNFGYVVSKVTVVLALETGMYYLRICIYLLKFALMINV
jgi:hypothetical protein